MSDILCCIHVARRNINNSTIANNEGGIGPGGVNSFSGGVANITSSIIANNTGSGDGLVGDINGEFISGGNNLMNAIEIIPNHRLIVVGDA
mgnify:CR=1 FL=1